MQTIPNVFTNPLSENSTKTRQAEPCILVIFGATGDLTARKLVPALFNLGIEGQLPAHFACVGFARREKNDEIFREELKQDVENFSRTKPEDPTVWDTFAESLYYHRSEFDHDQGYIELAKKLQKMDAELGTRGNRVFYLSTQPSFFPIIVEKLQQHGLIYNTQQESKKWSRVIIEKPFGTDLHSALMLQSHLEKYLHEDQIYRIDHYLGKETVQNLLVFRFANSIFESLWNNRHIDHVQITVAEDIGIGSRGAFWEEAGMLRDIIQNHMMQLLCLVAMEPPVSLNANAIRDEKTKVMQSIRPIDMQEFDHLVVRGQYGPGFIEGKPVQSYREEDRVDQESIVETYVAMKLNIDNWRWAGVPFYLRAGKRLPKRATEIAITFKDAPGVLFQQESNLQAPNVLVIRIQPDEGISLRMNSKVPGISGPIQPVKMDFRYGSYFGAEPPEAYERLICDCMSGDSTLFARGDEVLASWELVTPILNRWKEVRPTDFPNYASGTWGPEKADSIIEQAGHKWRII